MKQRWGQKSFKMYLFKDFSFNFNSFSSRTLHIPCRKVVYSQKAARISSSIFAVSDRVQQYQCKLCIDSKSTQYDFFRLKVISLSDYINKKSPPNLSFYSYIFGIIWSRRRDQFHPHGILKKLGVSSLSSFLM